MVGVFHEPSGGRRCEPIHSIPYSVAQTLERVSNNYYSIIQGRCVNMDKEMSLKNRDRLIQLGITISTFRKFRGLSQEQLAERASVSRSLISSIEAAGIAKSFSLEVFYNIADALEIEPATLLSAPTQFDNLLKQNT